MPNLYLVPLDRLDPGATVTLTPDRSNYLCRVMRINKGDLLRCTDGNGSVFICELVAPNAKKAQLQLRELLEQYTPPDNTLQVGLSLLKGAAQERSLATCVELGATHIWLFSADHSNVNMNAERRQKRLAHFDKVVDAAMEQCGRVFRPQLQLTSLSTLIDSHRSMECVVLEAGSPPVPTDLPAQDRLVLIGPEGGFSEQELAYFKANKLAFFSTGPVTLRAETMPSVALTLLQTATGWHYTARAKVLSD